MGLAGPLSQREYEKFVEDASGDTAIRVKIVDGIKIAEGKTLQFYDHRGFLVMELDPDTGNLKIKGDFEKL